MRTLLAAFALGLVLSGRAEAGEMTCLEALSRVDTFGELRWPDPPPALSGQTVDFDWGSECDFIDLQGVRYEYLDGRLTDKALPAGTRTPWPWGLQASDGPTEVKAKLARLLPNEGAMNIREGGPTYNLDIADCMAWIEVTFEGERGIKAVSLNAQP